MESWDFLLSVLLLFVNCDELTRINERFSRQSNKKERERNDLCQNEHFDDHMFCVASIQSPYSTQKISHMRWGAISQFFFHRIAFGQNTRFAARKSFIAMKINFSFRLHNLRVITFVTHQMIYSDTFDTHRHRTASINVFQLPKKILKKDHLFVEWAIWASARANTPFKC